VDEVQFSREADIGFIEGDKEEGEDLVNVDEKYLGALVEF
jgi:hypothetical protein